MMLLSAGSTTSVFPNNAQSEKKPEIPVALTKDLFEFSETPAISGYESELSPQNRPGISHLLPASRQHRQRSRHSRQRLAASPHRHAARRTRLRRQRRHQRRLPPPASLPQNTHLAALRRTLCRATRAQSATQKENGSTPSSPAFPFICNLGAPTSRNVRRRKSLRRFRRIRAEEVRHAGVDSQPGRHQSPRRQVGR